MKVGYRYFTAALFIILISLSTKAQNIKETPVTMFIEMLTDGRSAAMGGVSNISEASAFAVFNNASANLFSAKQLSVGTSISAQKDFSDNTLYSLGSFYNMNENNGLSLGIRYFNYSNIKLTDGAGSDAGSYKPKELTFDMAYGRKLTDNLAVSVTLRYIHSDMGSFMEANKADAWAAGLGLTYSSPMESFDGGNRSMALSLSNFGTKVKYTDKEYTMPASIKLGGAFHLPFSENHQLTAVINLQYRVLPSYFKGYESGVGAEYNLYKYYFLRGGYHLSDSENGLGNFVTIGAGIALKPIRLDITYWVTVPHRELRNRLFISLSAAF